MFHIEKVEIDGFWGTYQLETEFNHDVTIFIGRNGTGKTTLINMLQAVLTVDVALMADLMFDEIRMKLKRKGSDRKVSIKRLESEYFDGQVRYKIGRRVYTIPLISRTNISRRRVHSSLIENIKELRAKMNELVNISWLSVQRELIEDEEPKDRYLAQRETGFSNPIDRRLGKLMGRLTSYQLQLQSMANKLSSDFQKQVLASMLYSETFDKFSVDTASKFDLADLRDRLMHAYQALGMHDTSTKKRIDVHMEKLGDSLAKLREQYKDGSYYVDDVMPISLYRRTRHIVDLSTKLDHEKENVFKPLTTFLTKLREFASDKLFQLNPATESAMDVKKNDKTILIEDLSSGEKQLIILLTETLLQRSSRSILIADEPELSLHIAWQRKLLSAIRDLNGNAQVIVATHSPEIAGKWRSKIVNMENILHG